LVQKLPTAVVTLEHHKPLPPAGPAPRASGHDDAAHADLFIQDCVGVRHQKLG
jgi:hypothetical protein